MPRPVEKLVSLTIDGNEVQAPAGMMILDIALEVIGQPIDAGGEKRNLHFR